MPNDVKNVSSNFDLTTTSTLFINHDYSLCVQITFGSCSRNRSLNILVLQPRLRNSGCVDYCGKPVSIYNSTLHKGKQPNATY